MEEADMIRLISVLNPNELDNAIGPFKLLSYYFINRATWRREKAMKHYVPCFSKQTLANRKATRTKKAKKSFYIFRNWCCKEGRPRI